MNTFANVAQQAEQPPCERQVAGSNPGHWLQLSAVDALDHSRLWSLRGLGIPSSRRDGPQKPFYHRFGGLSIGQRGGRCIRKTACRPKAVPAQAGDWFIRFKAVIPRIFSQSLPWLSSQQPLSSPRHGGPGAARGCCRVHALSPFI